MIDLKNKIIFIHIPKTAGTSIEKYFQKIRYLDDGDISSIGIFKNSKNSKLERGNQHCSLAMIEKYFFGGEIPKDYKIFTVVRNPYTRFWSEWSSRKLPPPKRFPFSFYLPLKMLIYLTKKNFYFLKDFNSHMKKQSHYLRSKSQDRVRVLMFEDLSNEFKALQAEWNLPILNIEKHNKSKRKTKPTSKEKLIGDNFVKKHYEDDFDFLNYNVD